MGSQAGNGHKPKEVFPMTGGTLHVGYHFCGFSYLEVVVIFQPVYYSILVYHLFYFIWGLKSYHLCKPVSNFDLTSIGG